LLFSAPPAYDTGSSQASKFSPALQVNGPGASERSLALDRAQRDGLLCQIERLSLGSTVICRL
jgi:hypothetical protein